MDYTGEMAEDHMYDCINNMNEPNKILEFPVAGVKFCPGVKDMVFEPGDTVGLYWEKTNVFDGNAIRVEVQGKKIGYVPRILTEKLHPYRRSNIKLTSRIGYRIGWDISVIVTAPELNEENESFQ